MKPETSCQGFFVETEGVSISPILAIIQVLIPGARISLCKRPTEPKLRGPVWAHREQDQRREEWQTRRKVDGVRELLPHEPFGPSLVRLELGRAAPALRLLLMSSMCTNAIQTLQSFCTCEGPFAAACRLMEEGWVQMFRAKTTVKSWGVIRG